MTITIIISAPAVPPPPTTGLRISSFPLPALGTSAPYSVNGSSKHTNMASDGVRLYVTGGDWTHSATDGTWSMSLADGSWRKDHAGPVVPTIPAPHALQDGAGFEWIASKGKFLIWPGGYYPYEAVGAPIREWSRGIWWYEPVGNVFEQDARLFSAQYSGTGCLFGGIYDDTNGSILAFGDSSGGEYAIRRWDVVNGARLPDTRFSLARDPAAPAAYFTRGKPTRIGRFVYVIGYRTNGTVAGQKPLMFRCNMDTLVVEEFVAPPVSGPLIKDLEIRPAASRGKLVWPFTRGPEGDILGIYIYDPAANVWTTDDQVPSYGNFIANAVCSLPDGRIAMSGGVFGRQQTHMWFYSA